MSVFTKDEVPGTDYVAQLREVVDFAYKHGYHEHV